MHARDLNRLAAEIVYDASTGGVVMRRWGKR